MVTATRRARTTGTADFQLSDGTTTMPFRCWVNPETGAIGFRQGWAPMLSDEQRISGPLSAQQYPAVIDVPLTFETWHGGAGYAEADDREGAPQNYNYAENIDASIPNRLYLGPKVNAVQTDVAVAPDFFVETTLGLFACCGRYLYKFTQSSLDWVQVLDLGAGNAITGPVTEFNGVLFCPAGDTVAYRYSTNGTTWTTCTLADPYANQFTVRGRTSTTPQLWKISADNAAKSNTDGTNTGGAWSAAIPMGHTSETQCSFVQLNDRLFNFKTEGFASYGTEVEDVFTGGRQMRRTGNGVNAFVWFDGSGYVSYGDRLMQYDPLGNSGVGAYDFVLPLSTWMGNYEINGTPAAVAGDADWLYVAMQNRHGHTSIVKGRPGTGWHPIAHIEAAVDALLVVGPGVVHDENPVLLMGYGDGTRYLILPRSGLRPEDDTNYRFTSTGTLYGPWMRVGTKLWTKFLNAARAHAENCTAGMPISIGYQTDVHGAVTTLHTAKGDDATSTAASSSIPFTKIRPVITLTTGDETQSPRLLGAMFNTILAAPRKRMWRIEAQIGPGVMNVGGGQQRVDARQQEAFLFRAHGDGTLLTLYDRNARTFTVRILTLDDVRPTAEQPTDGHVYAMTAVEITETTQTDSTFTLDVDALDGVRVLG